MGYNELNEEDRKKHFEYLNKIASQKELSPEDSEKFIKMLVYDNPYTYKHIPFITVREPDAFEKKEKVGGFYSPRTNSVDFLLNSNISKHNLENILNTVGHEIKHYFQHKKTEDYKKNFRKYEKNPKYAESMKSLLEAQNANTCVNIVNFSKIVKALPLKTALSPTLRKLKYSPSQRNNLAFSSYYSLEHEYDARKAGENFCYGMLKSYANDPMIENYPLVKKFFASVYSPKFDGNHKKRLNNLDLRYLEAKDRMFSLYESLTKLAIKGHSPKTHGVNNLICHLQMMFYDKDFIKSIVNNNIKVNQDLSESLLTNTLRYCPKDDLKEFQDLYMEQIKNKKFIPMVHERLTQEQNLEILHTLLTRKFGLDYVGDALFERETKEFITPELSSELAKDIIETYKDKTLSQSELRTLNMCITPIINDKDKESAMLLSDFSNKKLRENLTQQENLEQKDNLEQKTDFAPQEKQENPAQPENVVPQENSVQPENVVPQENLVHKKNTVQKENVEQQEDALLCM